MISKRKGRIKMSKHINGSKKTEIIKKLCKILILCIIISILIIYIYSTLSYNLTLNGYNKNILQSNDVSVTTLSNSAMSPIYSDLEKQGYTSFIYGFNLTEKNSTYESGTDISVTINLSSTSILKNQVVNIYSYNKSNNTFQCLGEVKASDSSIIFKVNSLGEHFITLSSAPTYDANCETLSYNEEFTSTSSIGNEWTYDIGNNDGWGNEEDEYYTNNIENSNISNGTLNITALKESKDGYNYTSARLVSKKSFLYGQIEVCAKLPEGAGTWPAIWMLPTNNTYGNWPDSGEIDIMEAIGKQPNYIRGSLQMNAYNFKTDNQKTASIEVNDLYSSYHVYDVLWTPNKIELSVDGHVYFTYDRNVYDIGSDAWKAWPYNEPFNLILNLAIGGTYGGTVDNSIFPQTMSVKYIKVYDLNLSNYNLNTVTS